MARATLIDDQPEEEQTTDSTVELEAIEEVEQPEEPVQEEELPDRYKGKSIQDIVRMHQEAESLVGRQSAEVGELRKSVDSFIQAQTTAQTIQQEAPSDDEVDFFTDPKKAVSREIANHPKIREAEKLLAAQTQEATRQQIRAAHPDAAEILKDQAFNKWIGDSPVRSQLYNQADQQYDYHAANELLNLWKERTQLANQTVEVEKQARKATTKAAQTGKTRAAQTGTRKKQYRRADIINLMVNDPQRYQAIQGEIFQAYAEGRVK